jgi:hypothetical protein
VAKNASSWKEASLNLAEDWVPLIQYRSVAVASAGMEAAAVIGSKRHPNPSSKAAEDATSGNPKALAMNAQSTLEEAIYSGDWPLLQAANSMEDTISVQGMWFPNSEFS